MVLTLEKLQSLKALRERDEKGSGPRDFSQEIILPTSAEIRQAELEDRIQSLKDAEYARSLSGGGGHGF